MRFSPKQRRVLTWWCSPEAGHWEAVICDGAVRSGKTFCLGLSFFCWAMAVSYTHLGSAWAAVAGREQDSAGGFLG